MHDILFGLWLSMYEGTAPDDEPDDDDDDEGGGGLPAPVVPQPSRWPPRVRLFLPPALPVPCPAGA